MAPKKEITLPEKEPAFKHEIPDLSVSSLAEERKKRKKEKKLAKKAPQSAAPAEPTTPTLPPTPSIPETLKDLFVGQELSGRVTRVKEGLGAFIELSPTLTGLLHIANMSGRFVSLHSLIAC